MNSLFPTSLEVNTPTIDDAVRFADEMAKRGEYSTNTVRLLSTALKQLTQVLAEEEPRDVSSVLGSIDDIARRWGIANNGKPDTIQAYTSRARRLLQDFLRYLDDPANFRSSTKIGSKKSSTKTSKKRTRATKASAPETTSTGETTCAASADLNMLNCPLPESRSFSYTIPPDFSRDDLLRITLHLLPLTKDFKPEDVRFFTGGAAATNSDDTDIVGPHH